MLPVYLIGFMGCGKSTLGACLAAEAGVPFIDLDDYIARRQGMSVSELFARKGETAFRVVEREALREVSTRRAIISCGGGTPCGEGNMDLMNTTGTTVWLTAAVDCLVARLSLPEQQAKRPLLAGLSREALTARVTGLLAARGRFYGQAQVSFDSTDIETAATCRATARRLAVTLGLARPDARPDAALPR